jgi:hypothetical protein
MVAKILAGLLAVAVVSVGGYTYYQYSDGSPCCASRSQTSAPSTGCPSESDTPPCCTEPSRTSCMTLPAGEGCCDDPPSKSSTEVLNIPPREVK